MRLKEETTPGRRKRRWWPGIGMGAAATLIVVLASGFMIQTTNTDTFCISCHAMKPFRTAWQGSLHGGNNPKGFTAQCVDCHLPHGNFVEYLTAKAITGTGDVIQNVFLDTARFDWAANAEQNRHHFTYDSACRRCHHDLTPPGIRFGGLIAHRSYRLGETERRCAECHPHVGHRDMIEMAEAFFKQT